MAVPKKKVSRSRRNMRRFSAAYQLDPVTTTLDPETSEATRPHRVDGKNLAASVTAYVARKRAKKGATSAKA